LAATIPIAKTALTNAIPISQGAIFTGSITKSTPQNNSEDPAQYQN
jgi:hypothetical protein